MQKLKYKPAIVVVAYNRPGSLERILFSLLGLKNIVDVKLIISIDNKSPDNSNVVDIATNYKWPFGEKEVIYQEKPLGLRKHILLCAGLSQVYGSVIILEDDLFVSPYLYDYAVNALEFYDDDPQIGGISLYNQPIQEIVQYPFNPIHDESDVYFLQFPSSLGQVWTAKQWKKFRDWYDAEPDLTTLGINFPDYIRNWPETSWKKYFCAFLVATDKYFAFPRISFTTNFNDPGSNLKKSVNHQGQTPLRLFEGPYHFKMLSQSYSIYDVYLELQPDAVKRIAPGLKKYDFEMDLYGTKDLDKVNAPYIITSKPAASYIKRYKRALKPHEMNIICDLRGNDLFLCEKKDVMSIKNKYARKIADYKYFYTRNIIGWKAHLFNYYLKFLQRLK